jgi:hypothetical protein
MMPFFVLLQRYGFRFLNIVMLLALCALAAKWTWVFLAPAPIALPEVPGIAVTQAAQSIIADHLLTGKETSGQPPYNIKLEGVFAAENKGQGVAIFLLSGKSVMVPLKGQVMPGMSVNAIDQDHVVLDYDGVQERLNLEEQSPP